MTDSDTSAEETKTFTLTSIKFDVAEARMRIAAAATAYEVRLVSVEERRSRIPSFIELDVTVAGHPKHVRDFHEEFKGGSSGPKDSGWWLWGGDGSFTDFVFSMTVDNVVDPLWVKARKKWQARHDPPLPEDQPRPGPGDARTTVTWVWKQLLPDGDAVGPVRVDTYEQGQEDPERSEEWAQWVKRSEAQAFAQEHDLEFVPQDLPDQ